MAISHEDFILLHKLSDQLVTTNTQVRKDSRSPKPTLRIG